MPEVLIIDDIEATRETIREMLERGGYDVLEAAHGKAGLKIMQEHEPDIVVTDILMPEMEGLETIRTLRKNKPHLPIIAITAATDTPYLQFALKFGVVCGLYKPFKQSELLYSIEKILQPR